mmetsp:Transcript_52338/g.111925  ORF Transcript_52338/g.111925 Transcript_52338/m.111925 type:complete len:291 (+) Transcript_52338:158-1030(+)
MAQSLGVNDGILLLSLLYSCVDLQFEWDSFSRCSRPIHKWLLVSYACVIGFRLTHFLGTRSAAALADMVAPDQDFLLNLRHKGALPRMLASLTWLVALPFFALWTLLGTNYMWHVVSETPECVPTTTHLWFSGFWLVLCYIWITIHAALGAVAWVLERRVRRAEGDLRELEDADTLSRWGQVSQLAGYRSLPTDAGGGRAGLTPSEIRSLPSEFTLGDDVEADCGGEVRECPICINGLEPGDSVRRLPGCDHIFHRSCIDLWLLRRADCPLCKHCVQGGITSPSLGVEAA